MSIHYFRFAHRGAPGRQRSRLLERLLARADAAEPVTDWRGDAFRVIAAPSADVAAAGMPGVGAVALVAERGRVPAASVFMATPVHYVAEMSNVRLPADGILSLRASEADELAADFNRVWTDAGIQLLAGRRGGLFCLTDQALQASTHDPADVLDRHIENYLPTGGAQAPRLRGLMSEIEMWLFEHPVNRARSAEAAAVVNGLWLWGGGPALAAMPQVHGWTAGDDPFFAAVSPQRGMSHGEASGVVVTAAQPGVPGWSAVEPWLENSAEHLTSGRIERLDLSAGDRCFRVNSRASRRFWRRSRPWWESFP